MDDDARVRQRVSDASVVTRVRSGETTAFSELYNEWFDRAFDLARRIVRDDNTAADVVQEAFTKAWTNLHTLEDPASFGGWLLRIIRNAALNSLRSQNRTSTVEHDALTRIETTMATTTAEDRLTSADDPETAMVDSELVALVWEAAEALGERDATVLDLHLRHGLSPSEIGEVVGVNRNAANQLMNRCKQRLGDAIRARVLWRGNRPQCSELQKQLDSEHIAIFGPDALRVTERHAKRCATCSDRQRVRLAPAALFGAIPIIVAPIALKAKVAAALPTASSASGTTGTAALPAAGATAASAAPPMSAVVIALLVAVATVGVVIGVRRLDSSSNNSTSGAAPTLTQPTTIASTSSPSGTTTPNAASVSIAVSPTTFRTPTTGKVTIRWSTTGGARIEVQGANFASDATSGEAQLCPTPLDSTGTCVSPAGEYQWFVSALDADGRKIATARAVLEVQSVTAR